MERSRNRSWWSRVGVSKTDCDGRLIRRSSRAYRNTASCGVFLAASRWSRATAPLVSLVAGEWDNESDENVIESVTLTYDYFELVQ